MKEARCPAILTRRGVAPQEETTWSFTSRGMGSIWTNP